MALTSFTQKKHLNSTVFYETFHSCHGKIFEIEIILKKKKIRNLES